MKSLFSLRAASPFLCTIPSETNFILRTVYNTLDIINPFRKNCGHHYSAPDVRWGWDGDKEIWFFGHTLYVFSYRNDLEKVELPVSFKFTETRIWIPDIKPGICHKYFSSYSCIFQRALTIWRAGSFTMPFFYPLHSLLLISILFHSLKSNMGRPPSILFLIVLSFRDYTYSLVSETQYINTYYSCRHFISNKYKSQVGIFFLIPEILF